MSLRREVKPGISRRTDFPLRPSKAALLVIDIQKYLSSAEHDYFNTEAFPRAVKNIAKLAQEFRSVRDQPVESSETGCEVIYTYLQSSTKDGRDIALDYKLSGLVLANIPRIGDDDLFWEECQPDPSTGKGDILLPKTSCSVFQSTNLDYLLRNLCVEQLVIVGQCTDQCVESAVRDAADLGYFVTVVEDACAAYSERTHQKGLQRMLGFCRLLKTDQVIAELEDEMTRHQKTPLTMRASDSDWIFSEAVSGFLTERGFAGAAEELSFLFKDKSRVVCSNDIELITTVPEIACERTKNQMSSEQESMMTKEENEMGWNDMMTSEGNAPDQKEESYNMAPGVVGEEMDEESVGKTTTEVIAQSMPDVNIVSITRSEPEVSTSKEMIPVQSVQTLPEPKVLNPRDVPMEAHAVLLPMQERKIDVLDEARLGQIEMEDGKFPQIMESRNIGEKVVFGATIIQHVDMDMVAEEENALDVVDQEMLETAERQVVDNPCIPWKYHHEEVVHKHETKEAESENSKPVESNVTMMEQDTKKDLEVGMVAAMGSDHPAKKMAAVEISSMAHDETMQKKAPAIIEQETKKDLHVVMVFDHPEEKMAAMEVSSMTHDQTMKKKSPPMMEQETKKDLHAAMVSDHPEEEMAAMETSSMARDKTSKKKAPLMMEQETKKDLHAAMVSDYPEEKMASMAHDKTTKKKAPPMMEQVTKKDLHVSMGSDHPEEKIAALETSPMAIAEIPGPEKKAAMTDVAKTPELAVEKGVEAPSERRGFDFESVLSRVGKMGKHDLKQNSNSRKKKDPPASKFQHKSFIHI